MGMLSFGFNKLEGVQRCITPSYLDTGYVRDLPRGGVL